MDKKVYTAKAVTTKDEGVVEGVFATLNTIDLDGDVTLPGAFGEQAVKIAAWGHNWGTLPVGRGMISEDGGDAKFESQFFLDTMHGKEHFLTVKNLGDLQEWSYGFEVLKAVRDGDEEFEALVSETNLRPARFLQELNVFEVSPVMRGAGVGTHTTVAKSAMPFAEHAEQVLTDVTEFVERTKARGDYRAKEGRVLSAANREQLAQVMGLMQEAASSIKKLLADTEPEKGRALSLSLQVQRALMDAQRLTSVRT